MLECGGNYVSNRSTGVAFMRTLEIGGNTQIKTQDEFDKQTRLRQPLGGSRPQPTRTVAVFCSGGDAPAMNAFLRIFVRLGLHQHVVGVPATIDNDIACTEIAIGVDTALNNVMRAIEQLNNTSSTATAEYTVSPSVTAC